mgnify:CR=1 FL=1
MATLTVQKVTRLGITPSFAACTGGGDKFLPSANTYIELKNTSGGALTVTVAPAKVPIPDTTITFAAVSIPATTGDKIIGPFPADVFAAAADGLAAVTYSGVTSLTIAAFELSQP